MKAKRINIIMCIFIFIVDLVFVISLYGARVAFIQARKNEILSIYEKTNMIDYSDLWMKFSTVNTMIESILIWTLVVYLILLTFFIIVRKINVKKIVKNIFFLILLICINVVPYIIMSMRYEAEDVAMLWIDALIPLYYGVVIGLKYSMIFWVVSIILKQVKRHIESRER